MRNETSYSEVGRGPIAAEVKRSSQITEQLEIQDKLLKELSAIIETLDANLQTVSRPMNRIKGDSVKPEEQLVPLAETLRKNNSSIISCIDNLRDMISDLEL